MRKVLILQECGIRISELLQLPLDCSSPDARGVYYVRYLQGKVRRENAIPVQGRSGFIGCRQAAMFADSSCLMGMTMVNTPIYTPTIFLDDLAQNSTLWNASSGTRSRVFDNLLFDEYKAHDE
jgi:hypothetical protein